MESIVEGDVGTGDDVILPTSNGRDRTLGSIEALLVRALGGTIASCPFRGVSDWGSWREPLEIEAAILACSS